MGLLTLDREIAAEIQAGRCPCGGRLDRADFPRKARGLPIGFDTERLSRRLAFCCDRPDRCPDEHDA